MKQRSTEVLVAGLGPVGSIAALALAKRGIDVAALETGAVGAATDLRASTFHASTLEILDDLGAADAILNYGLKASIYQYRDRQSGDVFTLDMSELSDVTRFPFRLQCEQHRMAHDVAEKLAAERTVQVEFGRRLLFFEQDDDGVTAYVETATEVEQWRAPTASPARCWGWIFQGSRTPKNFSVCPRTIPSRTPSKTSVM